jgi:predicted transcriptional regulator/DNA-binding XRE family transcriptional regulator
MRRLRRELGLTQQAMADDLDISASYVALLERNQRPLTADLLLRLARNYQLDVAELAGDDAEDYARRLGDVLKDPLFADIDLPALEVADLATSFPGITEAMLRLHSAYAREQQALAAQRDDPDASGEIDPVSEARRFFADRRNHFSEIETRAEELSAEIAAAGRAAAWLGKQGTRVRYVPPDVMMGAIRRYDRHNNQLLLDDTLPAFARSWQVALHIAHTALREPIATILRGEPFRQASALALARRGLASYAAGAIRMPFDRFAGAAEARSYDIDALAGLFGVSFEQVAHRLTSLAPAGRGHVPFFLLSVDAAGNVIKRLDGAGFPFAAHGGGCPLWNVHEAVRAPGTVLTQWLELPDRQRFFSIARTVFSGGGGYGRPAQVRALALACAAEDAPRLVYATGIDPRTAAATPIGVSCRLCDRAACTARAVPPIGREVLPDDYRRTAAPFAFAES